MKKTFFVIINVLAIFFLSFPAMADEDPENRPQYIISVTQGNETLGNIIIETMPDIAPKHSAHFDSLVSAGFYDGLAFHRVIPDFMIQGGDPNTRNKPKELWGRGDSTLTKVPAEFSDESHDRGILSMARKKDINSATSQFFICVEDCPDLDGQYSIFGKVLEGMDLVDEIASTDRDEKNRPLEKIVMKIRKK